MKHTDRHSGTPDPSYGSKAAAWGVHVLTASSAVWGLLALLALMRGQWIAMFAWLGVAVAIDGVDGAMARRFNVKQVLPAFDGALLDNIVDYLTYAFIPAAYLCVSGLLPPGASLAGASTIALASAYQFSQGDAKTEDHFFKGFPSYWNLVALYLFLLEMNPWVNFAVVVLCAILVFVPWRYAYPSRMARYRAVTLTLTVLWAAALVATLALYPRVPRSWVAGSLAYVVYYIAVSAITARQSSQG